MPDYSDTRIQFRRGSYTQWANSNPVLASGEPGFDTTNNILKVGDGSTQWASLSGVGGNGGGGGGSTTFVGLLDTPANFTGAGGKIVAVNSAASALEYIAASSLSITESQISDLGSYLTSVGISDIDSNVIITETEGIASNDNDTTIPTSAAVKAYVDANAGGSEVNDLTSSVTWANVPDANITESSVVQHSGAIRITESQIVDLGHTSELNDLTANVTWANVPDTNITESSVVQHSGALRLTESQIVDLGDYVASGDNVSLLTNDANYLTSETLTSLGINANILKYTDENGAETDIDLSLYLDDTNLARLVSGTLDSQTAIATFTRDDSSTFTVDFSSLLSQAEINDLTASVTWANVPDTNITESSVVQHSGALRLTESQIVDLQSYLTSESNDLTTSVTWANVPDVNITESSVVQHSGALRLTESQISDLTHYTDGDVDIHLNTSTATNNQILSWTGTDYDWVDQTLVGTSTVVAPFAFVRLATTSNGSGTGMSWSNWDAVNGTMDFTFDNAQPDTNYIVVTDGEANDDGRLVSIQNKTVNGFEASFYDTNGIRTPSAADAYALIVYGSTPTTTVVGSGSLTDLSVTTTAAGSAALSYDNANGTFTYTPPDLSGYLTSFTETNDLTSAVTWANVPDANITESSVVQHSGALRITESQITDLQSYLTSVSGDTAPSLGGELNLNNNDIVIDCKNSTGSQILAGTPVYVSGYYSANGKALIAPARSDDSTKMPAIGVLNSTIDDGNEGTVGVMGVVSQINTNSFEVGETLYVGPTGGLTNVKPSGDSELIQNLGRVLRKDASQGKIILLGAGRSNDVPNSATFTGDVEANSFVKTGGTSSQFLKADGSVDSNTYLTSESNDLTTSVTWANVPDANITESSVVQHSGALRLTESQITDLGSYITGGGTTNYLAKWSNSNNLTDSVIWADDYHVGLGLSNPSERLHLEEGNLLINTGAGQWTPQYGIVFDTCGLIITDDTIGASLNPSLYDSLVIGEGVTSYSHKAINFANGRFSSNGDSQKILQVLRGTTTNASNYFLSNNGSSASLLMNSTHLIISPSFSGTGVNLPSSAVFTFTIHISCRKQNSTDSAAWIIRGAVKNNTGHTGSGFIAESDVSSTMNYNLIGSPIVESHIDSGLSGVNAQVVTSYYNGSSGNTINNAWFAIQVNGLAETNLRWSATVEGVVTTY